MLQGPAKPSTIGAYRPHHPALRWLEQRLPIGRNTTVFRTRQMSRIIFRLDFTRHGGLTATGAGAIYVGLGDEFDDDRRLVRATASKRGPEVRPTRPALPSSYVRR
jgi:hypothetical protein